ncbi:MAG: type III polyketide synthase, partial [Alphaproteobacteria bacterium]
MPRSVRLLSLATALPPHVLHQEDVRVVARTLFHASGETIERLLPVYDNAGIATRRSCVPIDWYRHPHGWKERNTLYVHHAVDLLSQAARRCLAQAGVAPGDVDTLITVSTSGIATPSLDARVMEEIPFRRDVARLPVFGLGCAGGVLGLGRAAAMARAAPGSLVLLLVVELCGLTFRRRDTSKSNVVATALFGDGAAAVLLSCRRAAAPEVAGWGEYTWPESLD